MGPGGSQLSLGIAFTFPAGSPQLSVTTNSVYLKVRATIQRHPPPLPLPELEYTTAKCRLLSAPHVVGTRQPPAEDTPFLLPRGVTLILLCSRSLKVKSKARNIQDQFLDSKS